MKIKNHLKVLVFATFVWILFLILGLPEYYRQYPMGTMLIFDIVLLIPVSLIIWFVFKPLKKERRITISLWYAFYFTVPLAVYDYLYCGIYLNYGLSFILYFWFLSIYYLIPWFLFPVIAVVLNNKHPREK